MTVVQAVTATVLAAIVLLLLVAYLVARRAGDGQNEDSRHRLGERGQGARKGSGP